MHTKSTSWIGLITLVGCCWAPGSALGFVKEMTLSSLSPDTINIDGSADDWYEAGYPCLELGKKSIVFGEDAYEGEGDYGVTACLAYDDGYVYLALDVTDDEQVRTKKPGEGEDHVEIWIDQTMDGVPARTRILFFPERKFPTFHPSLRKTVDGGKEKPIKGAKFTMESHHEGWVAELVLPLSSLDGLSQGLVASRWAIVGIDCDRKTGPPTAETVLATRGILGAESYDDEAVDTLLVSMEGVEAVKEAFAKSHGLNVDSLTTSFSDMAEDGRLEVIVEAPPVIGIMGPGFMSGASYTFIELPAQSAQDVHSIEKRDVTGDHKTDLVIRYTEINDLGSRSLIAVYSFVAVDMRKILVQETDVLQGAKEISCHAELIPGGPSGSEMLLVTKDTAKGWSSVTYKNIPQFGVGPVIPPWSEEESHLWVMQGLEFKQVPQDKIASLLEKASDASSTKKGKKGKKKKKKKK